MKSSKFNIITKTYDNKVLAFNSTSCALAEVEPEFLDILNNIEKINFDECSPERINLINEMKKGNFIIEDCVDEISILKFKNKKGMFSSNTLGLTIAPTLMCNFKCPYCYETPKNYLMTQKVQDNIVKYVEEMSKSISALSVTWYGGEPLLGKEIIFSLSEKFIKICKERNVDYRAFMVTNGYSLDEKTVNKMLINNIKSCQITVDGPAHIHNTRRLLKNGGGTFDKIIENIKLMKQSGGRVNIRVNIDKTNINYVEELLRLLAKENLTDLAINFGQVTAYTEACKSIESSCLNTEEYSNVTIKLQKMLHEYGFAADDYPYYPGLKGNYCCADQINAYVIDPDGYLYKCWNNIGDTKTAVGNVMEISAPQMQHVMNNIMWLNNDPFEKKCVECKLLPICMGGCPYLKRQNREVSCEKWKYGFEDMLRYTYEYKIQRANAGIERLPD